MAKLHENTATELLRMLSAGETTPVEVMATYLERIGKLEPKIHALTFVNKDAALKEAERAAKELKGAKGKKKPLLGMPIVVKECISTTGIQTTCCSKILQGYIPPYDATVVTRLKQAGAIIIAKSNMDEFAMGSSTERSCYGPTMNPWDVNRVPGGSSGGSGAAIAAREAPLALGSDTGGSIRCPAAYCGVAGIKSTYGRVSRYGLVAYANSLEQIGPITITARDSAMLLEVIAGKDIADSTSVDVPVDKYSQGIASLEGLKVGIPKEFFGEGLKADVKASVEKAVDKMKELGATTQEVSLPSIKYALPTYYLIAMCEASSNLARFDGLRYGLRVDVPKGNYDAMFSKTRQEGFGPEVRRRIILGTYALSAGYYDMFYVKALKARTIIQDDFKKALAKVDVLVGPTMPTTAFEIGTKVDDPLTMYLEDILTVPINLAGVPSLSVPVGADKAGMPIGMQVMGNFFKEQQVLGVGMALEDVLQFHKKLPPLAGA
ncbi:MAG: Asp-tRNA(Asn)/Glu-tRNA(Gln) amidotransferase subunit GatA [Candidatus Lokiarchaeota archaeon]|nr:Asp-tRNA(Asn)/Glu-tRNA(Gln) amidotransferase subunit GatA [Candidatus Lokiarchaeota archaeon]